MRLLFLYGPPAVGKLTIAKELAWRSGYVLFHNQLTVDFAQQVFPWGSEEYVELVDTLRLNVFERAARGDCCRPANLQVLRRERGSGLT